MSPPPPTLRSCIEYETLAIAPQSQRHVDQILWLARSLLLQSSRMSPFRRPVSAAKNSVPDSSFGAWFRKRRSNETAIPALPGMSKIFLAIIVIAIGTLIGLFLFAAFTLSA